MKENHLSTAIAALILSLASTVPAQSAGTVVAWGWKGYGQTIVPPAAQSGVTAITAGRNHAVALKDDGSAVAWGWNEYGQTTVPLAAQSGVTALAAGYGHTVALKNDGSLVAWGWNEYGQTTVPVAAQSGVMAIAAGYGHTVVLKNDGSVVAWGNNSAGQTDVPVAAQSGVMAIAAGGFHTVALKNDGTVFAWGRNNFGQTTVPAGLNAVIAIAAAGAYFGHTVALKNDGTVVAWGANDSGQTTVPAGLSGVMAIAAGGDYYSHTVALKSDGTVVAWGDYHFGQARAPDPAGGVVTAIAAGGEFTVALVIPNAPTITTQPVSQTVNVGQSTSFAVTAAGYYLSYQWRKDGQNLADATNATYDVVLPQTNHAGTYTVLVSNLAGTATSAPAVLTVDALISPVTVVAWGIFNGDGQTTVPNAAQSVVTAIAAGGAHTVALKNGGSVVAWGLNDRGQTAVPLAARSEVMAIAAGWNHTVALKNNGSVVAWGTHFRGEITVPVAAQSGVAAIAAGGEHTVALKNDGSVVAWGDNYYGQTTVPVAAQSGVTAIAGGGSHTVALKNDGSVVAWGDNSSGQTTVPVTAQSDVTAIAAGGIHTVALKSDGTVAAWGNNYYGQTNVPAGLSNVTAIAAGYYFTVALKNDGTVVAWGTSGYGQTTVPAGLNGVTAIAVGEYHMVALLSPTRLQFAAADYAAAENSGAVSLTVQRVGVLSGTQTVEYATQDRSALAGSDYTAQSGTVTFAPGETTHTVSIPILNDGVSETAETFEVRLSNLAGPQALLGLPATSTVTILDNDTGIQFSAAHYSVSETVGAATITVLRGDDLNVSATVDYATRDGTATAGSDYAARSGTLHFAAGEITQTIVIPILNDGLDEGSEDLHLALTNPSAGFWLGANRDAVLAILDDERPLHIGRGQLKAIAAGGSHTLALKSDGSLWAWGDDSYGQLGEGAVWTNRTAPVRVGTDNDWAAVAAGFAHSVGLKADGSLWTWGANYNGQLGDGTTEFFRPAPVRIGTDNDWSAITTGLSSTLALKTDGSLWAWGDPWGRTGPGRIGADNDWSVLTFAYYVGLALKTDGSLWLFPYNFGMPPAPQRIGTDNDWFTVTAGSSASQDGEDHEHYTALKADGSLHAWGANYVGQLGNGTREYRPAPVPIGADNDWAAITAGWSHSTALKQDGSLWAWGANWSGQLGIGATADMVPWTNRPVRAGSDNDWVVIAAGDSHTVGLKADGSVWTWGWNASGQLGIGTAESTNLPVRVGTDSDWAVPATPVSEFRITSQAVGGDGKYRLSFTTTNSRSYFILYRGTEVTDIHQPVDATFGPFVFQLSDPTPVSSNGTAFYRIRAVPLAQPLDSDGDGIDDGYELRYRTFLNPFNPADAALDFDGDGRSNLQEYRDSTDAVSRSLP